MTAYDLSFRTTNWDPSGFDFELAAFAPQAIDGIAVAAIVSTVTQRCKCAAYSPRNRNDDQYLLITIQSLDGFVFNGYVEIYPPDQLAIGGRAEDFYTGDESTDQELAQSLAGLALEVTNPYPTVHFAFGGAHSAAGRARRKRRDSYLKREDMRPSQEEMTRWIGDFCRSLRP